MPRQAEPPTERVANDLRRRVKAGEWEPGEVLPTVSELAEHYGVSRSSAGKAVRVLVGEGTLASRARWAVFVPGGQRG
jgi:GntR family transcriptional regulator